jgi:hypothetical protein
MKQRDIILILVPAFIFIVAWVIFNIYHNSVASTIPQTVSIQITPITPSFDTNTINSLKQRQSVNPIYEVQTSPSPGPNLPVNIASSLSASQVNSTSSANTPQASAGGTLVK